jgi:hypothetical protein
MERTDYEDQYGCRCQSDAFRVLAEIVGKKFFDENVLFQESALMCVLEGMVASGAAEHTKDLDSFLSTERLVRNWGWVFLGDTFSPSRDDREVVKIKGKRKRAENWRRSIL